LSALVSLALVAFAAGECANGCNGHGKCTSYDMCICNRNWQANDCSERVCQFGKAHVDTPKGDLNGDGVVSNANTIVVDNSFNYPYGTAEQFPNTEDSQLNVLANTGHGYMECSNKGKCDRASGSCTCYPGYEGVACQRASCPNSCSGHGTCKTISQLAGNDYGVPYKLWDKDSTLGCACDAGYSGPDCSQRTCKHGIDPLFLDDSATIKYSEFNFATLVTATAKIASTTSNTGAPAASDLQGDNCIDTALGNGEFGVAAGRCMFNDGQAIAGEGFWAIRFFDAQGEDWLTQPITAGANCATVVAALENLPNNVVPKGSTECFSVARAKATDELYTGQGGAAYSPDGIAGGVPDTNGGTWGTTTQQTSGQYYPQKGWEIYNNQTYPANGRTGPPHPWHMYFKMSLWEAEIYENTINSANPDPSLNWGEMNRYVPLTAFDSSAGDTATGAVSGGNTPPSVQGDANYFIRGYIYNIRFYGVPGKLKQPQIELYLDGARPSLIGAPYHTAAANSGYTPKVITKVWTDGRQGEDNDYFADHCDGVQVQILHTKAGSSGNAGAYGWTQPQQGYAGAETNDNGLSTLYVLPNGAGITQTQANALLKVCLGDSDFDTSNNHDVYNWDYGSFYYPHIIKLVRSVTTYTDGGYYAILYWDWYTSVSLPASAPTTGAWKLLNPFVPPDELLTDRYEVYTTKGTLGLVSNQSAATFGFGSQYIYTTNVSYDQNNNLNYDGDVSCEGNINNRGAGGAHGKFTNANVPDSSGDVVGNTVMHCLNVSDIFTFINWVNPEFNPPHINLYTAKRLYTLPYQWSNSPGAVGRGSVGVYSNNPSTYLGPGSGGTITNAMKGFTSGTGSATDNKDPSKYTVTTNVEGASHYMTHVITADLSTNWGVSVRNNAPYYLYKFFPHVKSTYNYVAECSNRGTCDRTSGVCSCFGGYTNDDCGTQSSLHL